MFSKPDGMNEPSKYKNGNDETIFSGTGTMNYIYFWSYCIAKIKRYNYIYHYPGRIGSVSLNDIDKT